MLWRKWEKKSSQRRKKVVGKWLKLNTVTEHKMACSSELRLVEEILDPRMWRDIWKILVFILSLRKGSASPREIILEMTN